MLWNRGRNPGHALHSARNRYPGERLAGRVFGTCPVEPGLAQVRGVHHKGAAVETVRGAGRSAWTERQSRWFHIGGNGVSGTGWGITAIGRWSLETISTAW